MAQPLIFAHRGASAEKPENTLAAFRRALALEVDGIELDVHVTRDGVPVVFHDASLGRLTGTRGRIARKTWSELQNLRVLGREPIPQLSDVLRLTRGLAVVQIEIKGGPVAPIIRAIHAARAADWVILASFHAKWIAEARLVDPAIPRMLISEGRAAPHTLIKRLTSCGAIGLSVNHKAIRSALWIRYFQQRGYSVWSWTVNEPSVAKRLGGWGIDAILGDDPALMRRAV